MGDWFDFVVSIYMDYFRVLSFVWFVETFMINCNLGEKFGRSDGSEPGCMICEVVEACKKEGVKKESVESMGLAKSMVNLLFCLLSMKDPAPRSGFYSGMGKESSEKD